MDILKRAGFGFVFILFLVLCFHPGYAVAIDYNIENASGNKYLVKIYLKGNTCNPTQVSIDKNSSQSGSTDMCFAGDVYYGKYEGEQAPNPGRRCDLQDRWYNHSRIEIKFDPNGNCSWKTIKQRW